MNNSSPFLDGLEQAFGSLTDAVEQLASDFSLGDFASSLIGFMALFLALWGTWVGIRAILRAGRLVK